MFELEEKFGIVDLKEATVCNGSTITKDSSPCITTPPTQWAYAAVFPLRKHFNELGIGDRCLVIRVEATIEAGRIGIAVAQPDLREFICEEEIAASGKTTLELTLRSNAPGAWLVVRNVADGGVASTIRIHSIKTYLASGAADRKAARSRLDVFDSPDALAINRARLEHLAELNLPIGGKSVLDVGCGVGHLSRFFGERDCHVMCVDARPENLARLQSLYPGTRTQVANVEVYPLAGIGKFDIVFCYGLIYHSENPIAALRNMAACCQELLLIETVIVDHPRPILELAEESPAINNLAITGFGCRPSQAFMTNALIGVGFSFVYTTTTQPDFPDFHFQSTGDGQWQRQGHLLRRVFVASRNKLDNPCLVLLRQKPE
jgi:SAM-dependent methyltransferase